MITFLLITLGVFFLSTIFFMIKFFKTRSKLKKIDSWKEEYDKISTHRKGFYTEGVVDTNNNNIGTLYIYVFEKEKFANGYSETEFASYDVNCHIPDRAWFLKSIKEHFISLKKTTDVEWLENDNRVCWYDWHIKHFRIRRYCLG